MINYLLICRSLTNAQRTAKALDRSGISAMVVRTPSEASNEGCGYCVKIPEKRLSDTLFALKKFDLSPIRIYMQYSDGKLTEVTV